MNTRQRVQTCSQEKKSNGDRAGEPRGKQDVSSTESLSVKCDAETVPFK